METDGVPGFGLYGHSNDAPSGACAARQSLEDTSTEVLLCWIHHQIASDVLLQDNMIFRSVIEVLLLLIYFTVSYFNFRLSYLFCS